MSDEHDDDDDDDDDGDNGDDGDDDGDGDDNGNDENEEDEDKDQEEDDVDLGEEEDKGDPSSSSSSRRPTGPLDSLLRKSRAADAGSDDPLATTQLSAAAPNAAAAAANGKKDNTGVIYISRIPPLLDLSKLRHLLAPHAGGPQHILRVYLVPEDPQKKRASRSGGRRHKSSSRRHRIRFVEGWIEIDSRRLARHLAEALHNTPMERKRGGSRFHDDLWSLRYLPRFRWAHLNEQFQIERKVRAARVRAEVAAVKRENEEYLRSVKKAKMLDGIAERKDKSKAASGGGRGGFELRVTREYRQRPAKNSAAGEGVGANAVPVRPMRAAILSKIFGQ
ncbi:hypothetical protein DFJ73DRAFT_812199 [Zopfochytrium polystomum]|nr:hypothetical protein DFJ73DRAFT_812199 [Zopfochytrium polystomum]